MNSADRWECVAGTGEPFAYAPAAAPAWAAAATGCRPRRQRRHPAPPAPAVAPWRRATFGVGIDAAIEREPPGPSARTAGPFVVQLSSQRAARDVAERNDLRPRRLGRAADRAARSPWRRATHPNSTSMPVRPTNRRRRSVPAASLARSPASPAPSRATRPSSRSRARRSRRTRS